MRDLNRWGWWLWVWLITLALVVAMAIRAAAAGPGELAGSLPTAIPTAPSTPTPSATATALPTSTLAAPTSVPTRSEPAEPAPARIRVLLGACYDFEPGDIISGRLIRGAVEIEVEAWFGANGEAIVHEAPPGEWALWLDLPGGPIAQSCEVLTDAVTVMPYWECGWGPEVGPP